MVKTVKRFVVLLTVAAVLAAANVFVPAPLAEAEEKPKTEIGSVQQASVLTRYSNGTTLSNGTSVRVGASESSGHSEAYFRYDIGSLKDQWHLVRDVQLQITVFNANTNRLSPEVDVYQSLDTGWTLPATRLARDGNGGKPVAQKAHVNGVPRTTSYIDGIYNLIDTALDNGEETVSLILALADTTQPTSAAEDISTIFCFTNLGCNSSSGGVVLLVTWKSDSADLSDLGLVNGIVNESVVAGRIQYTATVSNATGKVRVYYEAKSAYASATVNGIPSSGVSQTIELSVGTNEIVIALESESGQQQRTYTLKVTRLGTVNLQTVWTDAPVAAFHPDTTAYSATVSRSTAQVSFRFYSADAAQILVLNNEPYASGTQATFPLTPGVHVYELKVTDGLATASKTYRYTITQPADANASLLSLTTNAGEWSEPFHSDVYEYDVVVTNNVYGIQATPVTASGLASVKVNGLESGSGAAAGPFDLKVEGNVIVVEVAAEDGTRLTYKLNVIRKSSGNDKLGYWGWTGGGFTLAFDPDITEYRATVAHETTSIAFIATTAHPGAQLTLNDIPLASGVASAPWSLAVGDGNRFIVKVTSEDGLSSNEYTATITRKGSDDATLAALAVSGGALTPAFSPMTTDYTVNVPYSETTFTLAPTLNEPNARVTVNGAAVGSGDESGAIALAVGPNRIEVAVAAQDASVSKLYVVTIRRASAGTALLQSLGTSEGMLTPIFDPQTFAYTIEVDSGTASVQLTARVDGMATLAIDGRAVVSGQPSRPISLRSGDNAVDVVVAAEDGERNTYRIVVTRGLSDNAALGGLTINGGAVGLSWTANRHEYEIAVPHAMEQADIAASAAHALAVVFVNESSVLHGKSVPIPLAVGSNEVNIVVQAEDGTTEQTYRVQITREQQGGEPEQGPLPESVFPTAPEVNPPAAKADIYVNGVRETLGDWSESSTDDRKIIVLTVDREAMLEALQSQEDGVRVRLPLTGEAAGAAGVLDGEAVQALAEKHGFIELEWNDIRYSVPVEALDFGEAMLALGAKRPEELRIVLEAATADDSAATALARAAERHDTELASVPVSFRITVEAGDRSMEIVFMSEFVERRVAVDGPAEAVYVAFALDEREHVRTVPVTIEVNDGKPYAVIRSVTNSSYAVAAGAARSFGDMAGHWAENAVSALAGRLVVAGDETGAFRPGDPISRAEFATMLSRALGLPFAPELTDYPDVTQAHWYFEAVQSASYYRLMNGFEDGRFRPYAAISREQAMAMTARALAWTARREFDRTLDTAGLLKRFRDQSDISEWARRDIALLLAAGIVQGHGETSLSPRAELSRTEAAMLVYRLLENANFI
ncbi:cadherin-like beta sandwich domain-containing protein [Paenibacillus koleovorans]|uniref:cadherin-like beta sandwich domain-containing protein n=1 Tax=Paenibacillus koleovorans TaxID=121608 RepID=UPI000FD856FD|nr:cadherin-like beta sandwich domain-containing protein [Paenibacillus koleovorans]